MHYTICLNLMSSSGQVALLPAFAWLEQRGGRVKMPTQKLLRLLLLLYSIQYSMKIYPCKVHCRAVRVIEIKICVGRFVSKVFVPPRHDWFPERLETTCQISFVVKWHFRKRLIDRKKANLLESEPCDVWGLLKLSRKLNPVRKLETSQFDLEYCH